MKHDMNHDGDFNKWMFVFLDAKFPLKDDHFPFLIIPPSPPVRSRWVRDSHEGAHEIHRGNLISGKEGGRNWLVNIEIYLYFGW